MPTLWKPPGSVSPWLPPLGPPQDLGRLPQSRLEPTCVFTQSTHHCSPVHSAGSSVGTKLRTEAAGLGVPCPPSGDRTRVQACGQTCPLLGRRLSTLATSITKRGDSFLRAAQELQKQRQQKQKLTSGTKSNRITSAQKSKPSVT